MGRFVGGDKALEDAIRECRFVYGRVATHKQMQPPPHSLPLSLVPPLIGDAFERAFSERSMTGGRPTAGEWQSLLKRLIENLKHCPSDKSHTFSSHLGACPWCAVVQNGGPFYFVTVQVGGLQFICGAKELEPLWAQVSQLGQLALAVPSPTIVPRTPSPLPAAVVAARRRSVLLKFGSIGAIAAAVMLFVASIAPTTRTIPAQSPSVQSPADLLSSAEVVRAHPARFVAPCRLAFRSRNPTHMRRGPPPRYSCLEHLLGPTSGGLISMEGNDRGDMASSR